MYEPKDLVNFNIPPPDFLPALKRDELKISNVGNIELSNHIRSKKFSGSVHSSQSPREPSRSKMKTRSRHGPSLSSYKPAPDLSSYRRAQDLSYCKPPPDIYSCKPAPDLSSYRRAQDLSSYKPAPDLSSYKPAPDLSSYRRAQDLSSYNPPQDLSSSLSSDKSERTAYIKRSWGRTKKKRSSSAPWYLPTGSLATLAPRSPTGRSNPALLNHRTMSKGLKYYLNYQKYLLILIEDETYKLTMF